MAAETVNIGVGKPAKIRNPWAVTGLTFVTSAVYAVSWLFLATLELATTWAVAAVVVLLGLSPSFLLGIYGIFWLYFVLREVRDFGIARSDERLSKISPGWNVIVMIFTGWLVIPAILVLVLLTRRVVRAQGLAGVKRNSLPLLIALLVGGLFLVLPLFVLYGVLQDGLNRVWRAQPATATPAVSP